MRREAKRHLGFSFYREDAPEVVVGHAEHGVPVIVVTGGHRRRAPGLSFSDRANVAELYYDLEAVLREWPA